jgi:hypothetical protein
MRKIHVLGTPMQIVPPKKAGDRFGHFQPLPGDLPLMSTARDMFNRVDRDLFRGVDPSGHGRMPQDFLNFIPRSWDGYRVMECRIAREPNPTNQVRHMMEYATDIGGIRDVHHGSHLIVSSSFMVRLARFFASRTTAMGTGPQPSNTVLQLYGIPVLELPLELPLMLAAPAEQWMVIGR